MRYWVITLCLFTGLLLLCGCAKMNRDNVQVFSDLMHELRARGSGSMNDPALEFYFYTESGVGARLDNVHVQGSGTGEDGTSPGPSP